MALSQVWTRHRRELSVAIAYAALLGVLLVARPDFFAPANLRDLLVSAASLPEARR
jgi:hypothetical protein